MEGGRGQGAQRGMRAYPLGSPAAQSTALGSGTLEGPAVLGRGSWQLPSKPQGQPGQRLFGALRLLPLSSPGQGVGHIPEQPGGPQTDCHIWGNLQVQKQLGPFGV